MQLKVPVIIGLAAGLVLAVSTATAENPLVHGIGLTDPHGVVFGDKVYLYATHDFKPNSGKFVMKDWWVWSSSDLVHWQQEGTLHPEETFLKKPFNDCWATFGVTRNGKYYWYFSAGRKQIGVVTGDSPSGPWHDPLGKPLIAPGDVPTDARDPDILMDTDGQAYIVFGVWDYFIARLHDDMISLAEKPRLLELDRKFGPRGEGKTADKPSLHVRNGIYYLSWSSFYAMATNVYGPYVFKGSVIATNGVAEEFRRGDIYADRHGNFFTWHHQWYYACNDQSQPGCDHWFRDACISYVHYRDNGEMAAIRLDRLGVGQYDASAPRTEAENYFDVQDGDVRETTDGGFEVRGLRAGSWLSYPNVMHLQPEMQLSLRAACGHPGGCKVEIHEGNAQGKLLGVCTIPTTGGWEKYETAKCKIKFATDKAGLCFVIQGGTGELLRLDWFALTPAQKSTGAYRTSPANRRT